MAGFSVPPIRTKAPSPASSEGSSGGLRAVRRAASLTLHADAVHAPCLLPAWGEAWR